MSCEQRECETIRRRDGAAEWSFRFCRCSNSAPGRTGSRAGPGGDLRRRRPPRAPEAPSRRTPAEGVWSSAENVSHAPSPTRGDPKASGEFSTPAPQSGRPSLTTVPHRVPPAAARGVAPLTPDCRGTLGLSEHSCAGEDAVRASHFAAYPVIRSTIVSTLSPDAISTARALFEVSKPRALPLGELPRSGLDGVDGGG